jgi:peptide/nickel transport system substrate-binding protein
MKLPSLVAVAAAILTLSAGAARAESTLRIGLAEDADMLDPTLARTYVGRIVFASLCDKLFDIDENLHIVPQLALGYDISEDGKVVTVRLRPGVKFHDGEALDAGAAKFSLERHLNMPGSARKSEIAAVDHVDVVDPLTVRLVLKNPFSPLIAQLTDRAGMMVSPKAAKEEGERFALHPVCAGPYRFVERVQQDRIVVEKFDNYWNKDKVHIDRIIYRPIIDATVRLAALKSGGLDLAERVLATDIKDIQQNPKLKLSSIVELGVTMLNINMANGEAAKTPLGADSRVRKALELSLDRDAINQVAFNGEFIPGNQWVSPKSPYYQESTPVPKRDLATAKALLKDAGVKLPLPVDLMVVSGPENEQIGEMIQAMAGEAGFDVKIRKTEAATSIKSADAGQFQVFLSFWSGRADPDGNLYIYHSCGGPLNWTKYCDKQVDAWLDQARTTSNFDERKAIYKKVAAKVLDGGSIIYLFHRQWLIAHTTQLEGLKPIPDGIIRVVGLTLK